MPFGEHMYVCVYVGCADLGEEYLCQQEQVSKHIQASVLQMRGIVVQRGLWFDSLGSNRSSALGRPRSPKSQDPFSFQFVLLLLREIMWIPFLLSSVTLPPRPTLEHSFPGNLQPLRAFTTCKGPEAQRKNEGEGWIQPSPAGQLKVFRFLKPVSS